MFGFNTGSVIFPGMIGLMSRRICLFSPMSQKWNSHHCWQLSLVSSEFLDSCITFLSQRSCFQPHTDMLLLLSRGMLTAELFPSPCSPCRFFLPCCFRQQCASLCRFSLRCDVVLMVVPPSACIGFLTSWDFSADQVGTTRL